LPVYPNENATLYEWGDCPTEEYIKQCEKAKAGYHEENGRTYWLEADGDTLRQVFEDGEEVEYSIVNIRYHFDNMEIELHA